MKLNNVESVALNTMVNCFDFLNRNLIKDKFLRHILKGLEGWIIRLSAYFQDVDSDGEFDED